MINNVLSTHNLNIGYRLGGKEYRLVASGLELSLNAGELVCLIGPNGAGKTTLLRTLAALQKPLDGSVDLAGKALGQMEEKEIAKTISLVLTEPVAVGQMRVEELVGMGRFPFTNFFDNHKPSDEQAILDAMRLADAENLAGRYFTQLSDGERQHVMVARALAQEPKLMILDEPTAFLDLPGRVKMMLMLQKLAHQEGKAVLCSTHDLDLALQVSDWVWLMDRDGSITQGSPEDLVLRGEFGKTFNRPGVEFDPASGKFKTENENHQKLILRGNGIEKFWTMRALIRVGFDVLEEGESDLPLVETLMEAGKPHWRLRQNGGVVSHSSIYSLVYALKEQNPT
ncbi:MAG TPA: ABC transporter ATP-binding protein [Anaerolineaceae bacterium]|nr:ABC transporter ATP-binding protein [Anaerolineaceae bacterium]